ncbi:MAG: hypothetical protein KAS23_02850 [Anaerohalosphaera sp.]|nr:hypothetical protein [Anaerohalosphaera sp.]
MYLIGYDIGTSSIKATLLDADTGSSLASATSPDRELPIIAAKTGYAEQQPETWWENVKAATGKLLAEVSVSANDIGAIGITYQMHGLVCVDKKQNVIRPAIIWCDSRAVGVGDKATGELGSKRCLENLLNYPGNFTACKLKWVKDNEPDNYARIDKMMLPGDYIAMKMTDRITTTASGLSEGMLWNFKENSIAGFLLAHLGISETLIPELVPTFGVQGELSSAAAAELGLAPGTLITYRAGDQPNNALSLNVLQPGEIAATAGTSGVVYGIGDKANYDPLSRVNTFLHVNNTDKTPRNGVLLCVNGTGILNSFLKHNIAKADYPQMNALAATAPVGSDGLTILPFGNGAERTLENKNIGASFNNLDFNIHSTAHILRAAQEGIVFALNYGLDIMRKMDIRIDTVRAGHANMFLSPIFAEAFATTTGATVELYDTDGSQGAARGAGIGSKIYQDSAAAFVGLNRIKTIEPDERLKDAYSDAYNNWLSVLNSQL